MYIRNCIEHNKIVAFRLVLYTHRRDSWVKPTVCVVLFSVSTIMHFVRESVCVCKMCTNWEERENGGQNIVKYIKTHDKFDILGKCYSISFLFAIYAIHNINDAIF